jgi:GT2 family glycosyltransferase
LPEILVTVAIPTLAADERLQQCLDSLARQTRRDFEVVIVDNSGKSSAARFEGGLPTDSPPQPAVRVIANSRNLGFGAAINQAFAASRAPYLATLNDDAAPDPGWLEALVAALDRRPDAGMCASQVRLFGEGLLDSAGMLVAGDGSSKQRGHGRPPTDFPVPEETLFPSGSAALYRRAMLEQIGGFDASFFLYCEDTDLGLRAIWAGWQCRYAAEARVTHRYSWTAQPYSALKARYVERNRLWVALKNFPLPLLILVPFASVARYGLQLVNAMAGKGAAASFLSRTTDPAAREFVTSARSGSSIAEACAIVWRAHFDTMMNLPALLRKRAEISRSRRIGSGKFIQLVLRHRITVWELARA